MMDFEKLGAFYLGKAFDRARGEVTDDLLLYDSQDLTTHAVIIGMTGSGKTGLGLGLLEEALIDGVPVIAIDPKGDIGNLLLTFPDLAPSDLRPWVNAEEAARRGLDVDAFAAEQAAAWTKGLAAWGQDPARVRRLRDAADLAIYTPGSSAGRPVSLLRSFEAPPEAVRRDATALRDRIMTTVASVLGLCGIASDPLRGRESILLSTILHHVWSQGGHADLASLVSAVQQPPFQRVGVMELDTFYPPKERFELAMALNALLASPGFAAWLEGEPLDVKSMLYTAEGRPRGSVFSIAHLGDAERMFFVALLLNEILGWMRAQPGTSSLRAVLYMDEIFGYFPPLANPPSKTPLLTLLKQARAFGLGVVLATQNPVDLDYKGLGNTGTWFVGRLQTERDKKRVLEALEGVLGGSGAVAPGDLDEALSSLGKRVFLLHNVHEGAPALFQTRWTMSYLAGPLTPEQIRRLTVAAGPPAARSALSTSAPSAPGACAAPAAAPSAAPSAEAGARPVLPPGVKQVFFPGGEDAALCPRLLAAAQVRYTSAKLGVDAVEDVRLVAEFPEGVAPVDWENAEPTDVSLERLHDAPPAGATFVVPVKAACDPKAYARWHKELARWVATSRPLTVYRAARLKLTSLPGESEQDFRIRLATAAREQRDAARRELEQRYAPKFAALNEKQRRARERVLEQEAQAQARTMDTAISIGAGLLGAFLGRRGGMAGRAGTAARSATRAYKEKQDVARAAESEAAVQQQLAALSAEFAAELQALASAGDEPLERVEVRAKSSDVAVQVVALAWVP